MLGPVRKLTPFAPVTRASPTGVAGGVPVMVNVDAGVGVLVMADAVFVAITMSERDRFCVGGIDGMSVGVNDGVNDGNMASVGNSTFCAGACRQALNIIKVRISNLEVRSRNMLSPGTVDFDDVLYCIAEMAQHCRELNVSIFIVGLVSLILMATGCEQAPIEPTITPSSIRVQLAAQPTRIATVALSPTFTPQPSATPSALPPTELPDVLIRDANADVVNEPAGPTVLLSLSGGTSLTIIGRTSDNDWLHIVMPDGRPGWLAAASADVLIDLETVSISGAVATPTVIASLTPAPISQRPVVSGITSYTNEIFQRGQANGKRANIFSKVGDSLTVASYVLYPIGWGTYNLRAYQHFQPAINFFSSATARDGNSFSNNSLAADNGWTTQSVLDPTLAHPQVCLSGESPLICEYRVTQPAIALILLGTNDVGQLSATTFQENLRQIVQLSVDAGIIPVLSTLPERYGYPREIAEFNAIINQIARENGVPLWDYGDAMRQLPNAGLSADFVHPSWPPGDVATAADFTEANLQYGYVMRNLTALQVLDVIWRRVINR